MSAAELRARGQEDFGVLVNILLQDAAAAAQCLPWALDLFEKALGLRSALAPSVDAASGPAAPGHGQGIRPAAGLFFALADRVCALLPGRRGDEKPDRSYARELEMLGALLAWMLASRERLAICTDAWSTWCVAVVGLRSSRSSFCAAATDSRCLC